MEIMNNNTLTVTAGLIKGRHKMPVERYIINKPIDDVMDFGLIRETIEDFIENVVDVRTHYGIGINQADNNDVCLYEGKHDLICYVTGLTSVTAELVRVCMRNGVHLTLMHYNTADGCYYPQRIY